VLGDERYGFREIEAGQPARAVRRSKSPRDKLTSAPKYDRAALPPWPHERLALHARLLGFTHPVTGKAMRFETSVPEEMDQLLREHRPRS
jgi:23S rRNA-/tRNA-specific pseudouridylate synthase